MPKAPPVRSRSELIAGIPHIINTLERTQTLYNWLSLSQLLQFAASNGAPVDQNAFKLTGDACLDATAIALRSLEDFLFVSRITSKNVKEDDILAEEYGFIPASGTVRFLTDDQRVAINKRIMHLSWHRVDGQTMKMDSHACLKVVPVIKEFMTHLEKRFLHQSDPILPEVTRIRVALENQDIYVIDPLIGAGPPSAPPLKSGSNQ